ncbi:hypothetical protein JNL27_10830 [bacterium]|nr:hypothetical protein [bacterium]
MRILLIMLLLLISQIATAQNSKNAVFLSGGLGSPGIFVINYNFTAVINNNLISLGYLGGDDLTETPDQFTEYSFLYGRSQGSRWARFSIAAGIAVSKGHWEDYNEDVHHYEVLGLPIEGQVIFTPLPAIGIGLKMSKTFRKKSEGPYLMATIYLGNISH